MHFACTRSLAGNELCGVNWKGNSTYTAAGIITISDALKGSSATSLTRAAHRYRYRFCGYVKEEVLQERPIGAASADMLERRYLKSDLSVGTASAVMLERSCSQHRLRQNLSQTLMGR